MTLNGKVEFSRYVLRPKAKADQDRLAEIENAKVVVPLDCYLGLSKLPFKMTVDLMLEVAYWAQNESSYQAAEEAVWKATGLFINDDTIRAVSNHIGSFVFNKDCEKSESAYKALASGKLKFPQKKIPGTLYIETDGAALNTRAKNEDGSSWRENKLGVVFSSDNIHFWSDAHGKRQHTILKREYSSYVGAVDEFKKHLFACALRNGYGKYEETVLLSDGATWIRNAKEELFPDAQQILDYFHLCENVYDFAKQLFNLDESLYKPWSDHICKQLKESRSKEVLVELDALDKHKVARATVNLSGYIRNNINNIDYASYIRKGYFIGSGAIESGNKVVLQKRLKQAGMRWNTDTAQCLLTLKAKKESDLWYKEVVQPIVKFYELKK